MGATKTNIKKLPHDFDLHWLLYSFMKFMKIACMMLVNREQCMLVALHVLTMALAADKNIN